MNNKLPGIIIRFILFVLFQVFVLNNILVRQLVSPSVYFLFLLILPLSTPRWSLLIYGFLLGLSVDIFMDTQGIHAASCVLIAFIRPAVISLFLNLEGMDSLRVKPSVSLMGWSPFLIYALVLTFVHHLIYYTLEIFDFHNFFYISLKILMATLLSVVLIILFEMLFVPIKRLAR